MANINNNEVFDLVEGGESLDLFKNDKEKQKFVSMMEATGPMTQVLAGMVKDSRVMGILGDKYDIDKRIHEADVKKEYTFDEMNALLGVGPGPTIDIQDVLQQRDILKMDINKMNKSMNLFNRDFRGTETKDLNKVFNSLFKLSFMIDTAVDWSEEDTARESNIMNEEILEVYRLAPGEFPEYKNIEELKTYLYSK